MLITTSICNKLTDFWNVSAEVSSFKDKALQFTVRFPESYNANERQRKAAILKEYIADKCVELSHNPSGHDLSFNIICEESELEIVENALTKALNALSASSSSSSREKESSIASASSSGSSSHGESSSSSQRSSQGNTSKTDEIADLRKRMEALEAKCNMLERTVEELRTAQSSEARDEVRNTSTSSRFLSGYSTGR